MKTAMLWMVVLVVGLLGLSEVDLQLSLGAEPSYVHIEFPRFVGDPWLAVELGEKLQAI